MHHSRAASRFAVLGVLVFLGLRIPLSVQASDGCAHPASSPEPALLGVGYGLAGIADAKQFHSGFLEWRGAPFWRSLAPYVFGSWRRTGASYVGAGLIYGIDLSPHWRLSASSGPGYFERDGDLDLGSRLEFASTIELAYRLPDGRRLACGFGHVSNAGAGRINPGAEFIRLSVQFPLSTGSIRRSPP
ncbi:MAG: acyloxyacyl hydrolase [Opitutaceae bacterium]